MGQGQGQELKTQKLFHETRAITRHDEFGFAGPRILPLLFHARKTQRHSERYGKFSLPVLFSVFSHYAFQMSVLRCAALLTCLLVAFSCADLANVELTCGADGKIESYVVEEVCSFHLFSSKDFIRQIS